jgi:hypothetical protein
MITKTRGEAVQRTGKRYLLLSIFAQPSRSTTRRSHCEPYTKSDEIAHRTASKMEGSVVDVVFDGVSELVVVCDEWERIGRTCVMLDSKMT